MRTVITTLFSVLFISGCSTPKQYIVEICPSLCESEVCVIDDLYQLSKNDITQLVSISEEYESDKLNYDNINLEVLQKENHFIVHAYKCDYYGVEILVEKKNDQWKEISAKQLLF